MQALLGLTTDELKDVALSLGLPAFTGKQIAGWLYDKKVSDIAQMTNLSKVARERLSQDYCVGCSAPVDAQRSVDGTVKYLYRTAQGDYIETVYIPDGERATLCVSCQVGCKMGCKFCMTGRQGYAASLSAADILNQIYSLPERDSLTNIVFMGQGEPFDNLDNVRRFLINVNDERGINIGYRHISLSTCGLADKIIEKR